MKKAIFTALLVAITSIALAQSHNITSVLKDIAENVFNIVLLSSLFTSQSPSFFYFFNLTVISRYTNTMEMYRFIQE